MPEIHDTAARGFDDAAEVYERARPGYPAPAVDWLVARLGADARVVDLAAGTGKLTTELVARGVSCIGVEPVAGMRAQFSRVLPNVRIIDGTAEAMPLADASADAVTVAQAFHWFDHGVALREIRRVLRAGGVLALIWNFRDHRVDWMARLTEMIDVYAEASAVKIPRHRDGLWQPIMEASADFTEMEAAQFEHEMAQTPDTLAERVASTSFIAVLPDAEREAFLERVRDLARTHPDLAGRATFGFPYVTEVALYRAL